MTTVVLLHCWQRCDSYQRLERFDSAAQQRCDTCGCVRRVIRIQGTLNPSRKCTASCKRGKSGDCDCSCAGANHGIAYQ